MASNHAFSRKESIFELGFAPILISELEQIAKEEFATNMLLSKSLEDAISLKRDKRITNGEFKIWFKSFIEARHLLDLGEIESLVNGYGVSACKDKARALSESHIQGLRLKAELHSEKPRSKGNKIPSRKELSRLVTWEHNRLDIFIHDYCDTLARKVLHIKILEDVISQANNGEISMSDFDDWVDKWINSKDEAGIGHRELREKLGLGSLNKSKIEIDSEIQANLLREIRIFREKYKKTA